MGYHEAEYHSRVCLHIQTNIQFDYCFKELVF